MRDILYATALSAFVLVAPVHADGKAVYDQGCFACHAVGVAGAPKLGSPADWAERVAKGKRELYTSSLNGLNAMPPKGGFMHLGDDDIKSAVDYMVEQAGGYINGQ